MKRLNIFLVTLASASGAFATEVAVSPGQLDQLIKGGSLNAESSLKLSGHIDARDLAALENIPPSIKALDLSGVTIDGLMVSSREYFGRTLFKEGEIPPYTFFNSKLVSLTLPAKISDIGEGAFAASSLKSIVIPEGVAKIDNYAFYGCPDLTEVALPTSLQEIGKGAFGNCLSLKSVDLSSTGVTEIPEKAFAGALQLESVTLPPSLTKVGREAFSHTKITTLNLSGVKEYEPFALSGMTFLENLTIDPTAKIPAGLLMDNVSLASLQGSPNDIPDYFAANCSSLDAQLTVANAETMGRYAFANNPSELLILPRGLASLDRGVISGMNLLKKIDASSLEGNIPAVDDTTFEGITQSGIELYVTDKDYSAWVSHPVWGLFIVTSDTHTDVNTIEAAREDISIRLAGRFIVVDAPDAITDIRIYSTDGRTLYSGRPGETHFEYSIDNLPKGVVILVAADASGNSKNASILIN